jgi:hypothetical protein
MLRQLIRVIVSTLVLGICTPASAAVKDAATLKKVNEALNVHFPAGKYSQAESVLQAAIKACGTKFCSGEVLAKAHVAVGIVRGKASEDLAEARKAFERAKEADPNATLDTKLVTPAVAREFYKAMGRAVPREVANAAAGNLHCTPASGYEIQTAQPIAVVCDPLEGVVRAEIHYRMEGEADYTALLMSVQEGTLRANIPCEPLTKRGKLQLYIVAQDINKERIDGFGARISPAHYNIVDKTKDEVPSYPGQAPPKRCDELLVGVGSQGESCTATQPCKFGLYCAEGICQKAPTCETDSDCKSGSCNNGYCSMDDEQTAQVEAAPKRWMLGLHFGVDTWVSTRWNDVCGNDSLRHGNFYCYNRGQDHFVGNSNRLPMTDQGDGGDIAPGLRLTTMRVMGSVDYVLKPYLSVGIRLGWAFLGGPRAVHYNNAGAPRLSHRFIPVHAEARGTLWLRSLGKPGLHPYVHLSAGLAEVDAKFPIKAKLNGTNRQLDAWRKMGPVMAGGGFGALYNINQTYGIQLNVNAMCMLPTTGFVFEPSLGGVVAF